MSEDRLPSFIPSGIARPLAIVLMVVGVASFILSIVLFGDQVLPQLISTVVTLAGVGLLLYMRRNAPPTTNDVPRASTTRSTRPSTQWETVQAEPEPVGSESLADEVVTTFEKEGAQVTVETRRADRCILNVILPRGEHYTVIVNDSTEPVDVGEIRALAALVANNGSQLGYYITDGNFTPRAITWSSSHPIQLIDQGQLELIFES